MKAVNLGLFCPVCGNNDVWQDEENAGDYYAGTACYCLTCHASLPDIANVRTPTPSDWDADALGGYIAIRESAGRDVALYRVLHAAAVAARDERNRARERRL